MSEGQASRLYLLLLLSSVVFSSGCDRSEREQPGEATAAGNLEPAEVGGASPAEAPEPQEGELLLTAPPPGWVETGAMRTPMLRMAEYGPPHENDRTIERITLEAQRGEPLPDPIEFVLGVSGDLASRCEGFQNINVSSGYENGYPTSVRLMICPRFKDSPHAQVVMAKAIRGEERFYVVTRRRQGPPMAEGERLLDAQAMAEWTTHLKAVRLCDTRSEDHPCPESVTGRSTSEAVVGDGHDRAAVGENALLEREDPRE